MSLFEAIILCDNVAHDRRLKANWGFSALLRGSEVGVLFDAGPSGSLLPALKALGISPREISMLVISHLHGDHYGGAEEFLRVRQGIPLYVPPPIPPFLKASWQLSASLIEADAFREIGPGLWVTGHLGGRPPEQALLAETPEGLLMVVGCAHLGIVEMVKRARELKGECPRIILGGLHLMGLRPRRIHQIARELRKLGVEKIIGCHCTGKSALSVLREEFGETAIRGGAGKIISLEGR